MSKKQFSKTLILLIPVIGRMERMRRGIDKLVACHLPNMADSS
jgi:hypothetical protein